MAFFHHPHHANQGFTPLFRMLEDFDRYSNTSGRHLRGNLQSFQPKFDMRETDGSYELHGELAGMSRDDLYIEFSDPQNLTVRGKIARTYTAGTPPAGLVESGGQPAATITESGERGGSPPTNSHQATVEDEGDDAAAADSRVDDTVATPATSVAEPVQHRPARVRDTAKYWISERSIGEFSRTFNFPQRVEQDGVTANLKDGILSVVVPKAKKHEARRITVS